MKRRKKCELARSFGRTTKTSRVQKKEGKWRGGKFLHLSSLFLWRRKGTVRDSVPLSVVAPLLKLNLWAEGGERGIFQ